MKRFIRKSSFILCIATTSMAGYVFADMLDKSSDANSSRTNNTGVTNSNSGPNNTGSNVNNNMKASKAPALSANDKMFFEKAAQIGLYEVKAGNVAVTRGVNAETKSFGKMMTTDHADNNNELKALAMKKSVTLPTALDDKHQKMLEKLQKEDAKDFDDNYADNMVKGHKDAIELCETTAKDTKDADIRAFANKTLPVLRKHLQAAENLDKKM
ncbi:MAG: DUF4142 domain-containing protein [Gammaproteobacteria bacterium]|nr:DUF4142 domain-containing protein [Gammaproteobacteria bacterium]